MLEVAAIIAYKQPVTRIDLEELRGSNSEFALQNLLKLGVIEVVGRKDSVGKPVLFGTTDEFLKRFQISSLEELPDYEELMEKIVKMRSPTNDSSYLFEKDEYVENDEGVDVLTEGFIPPESNANVETQNDDFELPDIDSESLPDYLKGEELDVIK